MPKACISSALRTIRCIKFAKIPNITNSNRYINHIYIISWIPNYLWPIYGPSCFMLYYFEWRNGPNGRSNVFKPTIERALSISLKTHPTFQTLFWIFSLNILLTIMKSFTGTSVNNKIVDLNRFAKSNKFQLLVILDTAHEWRPFYIIENRFIFAPKK